MHTMEVYTLIQSRCPVQSNLERGSRFRTQQVERTVHLLNQRSGNRQSEPGTPRFAPGAEKRFEHAGPIAFGNAAPIVYDRQADIRVIAPFAVVLAWADLFANGELHVFRTVLLSVLQQDLDHALEDRRTARSER